LLSNSSSFSADDEEYGAVFDLRRVFDGREMEQLVADGRADQVADDFDERFGVAQFAMRAFGRLVVGELSFFRIGDDPARIKSSDLADNRL
jgi:hypothetical protein